MSARVLLVAVLPLNSGTGSAYARTVAHRHSEVARRRHRARFRGQAPSKVIVSVAPFTAAEEKAGGVLLIVGLLMTTATVLQALVRRRFNQR